MGKDGTEFPIMPFEYPENCASGKYNYTGLMQRLNSTKATLEAETEKWKVVTLK